MEQVPGQTATAEMIEKGRAVANRIFESVNHVDEADSFSEAILRFVASVGAERGMSPEQQVFAVATTTIHLRKTFPGGTARFDEICRAAQEHYEKDG